MPRGGYRPNSGPKKGTKYRKRVPKDAAKPKKPTAKKPAKKKPTKKKLTKDQLPEAEAVEAKKTNLTPLEYILGVINDPLASDERKDRLAGFALPYTEPKPGIVGKKQERDDRAKAACAGKFAPSRPPLKAIK